jgi:hypothetical protein
VYVTRVTFRSELPSASQENAAMEKQLDAAQKQLSKDMASGNMIAQIMDFVDISVDAVAAATAPSVPSSSTVLTTVQVPDPVSTPDSSTPDPAAAPVPAATIVNQPAPTAAAPVVEKPSDPAVTSIAAPAAVAPGR